jgi:hypothetical protein
VRLVYNYAVIAFERNTFKNLKFQTLGFQAVIWAERTAIYEINGIITQMVLRAMLAVA